ncbi:dihydrofolate reductase [Kribbella orskensis]|uniref:Dihydrofolate reductase n=1 Tax=Kribbella orskensis TaxID=2512216 RepID=A0ABY2BJF8_9ACTN|nr:MULTISPECIES: dihydrofolate reductase family protein [Kribbella]TCN39283.1 dihydrofolate reductase [Kribbella sp. VKM Ac-2500]TCO21930.1 dihydrofolate reductase [Kribbella orskensis]
MRKITAGLFISLDGVIEAPETWHFPYFNEEMGGVVGSLAAAADTMLLGRNTWQMFSGYWPNATDDVELAGHMNDTRKLVISTTLTDVSGWQNSEILAGDPAETLAAIKETDGKDLSVVGSVTLVRSLLRAKLLDELHLLVHPIAVGHGAKLFVEDEEPLPLELISSTAFSTGVLHSVYRAA